MWDSMDKLARQIAIVAKDNFVFNGKQHNVPMEVAISGTFWRRYICHPECGGCCSRVSLEWLPDEWESVCAEYSVKHLGRVRTLNINGTDKEVFSIDQPRDVVRCRFFGKGNCTVHKFNPLSCQIELIKFKRIKDKGYILKAPYGRGWQMKTYTGAPILCEFAPFSEEQFLGNDIPVLRRMLRWSNYLEIDTHLPYIIDMLLDMHRHKAYGRAIVHNKENRLF